MLRDVPGRLWLNETGAIAAGAFFGLSSMLAWQDWYHLNIAVGSLFLPMTLEAVVRLRRCPGLRQSVILGIVLGASILVNQESTVLALILTAAGLLPWLVRHPSVARLRGLALAAGVSLVIASPQLIAMVQQARAGGASADADLLALTGKRYGVAITDLFAPAQRVTHFGLDQFAAASSTVNHIGEQMPMFGLLLSVLAVAGLAVRWRRRSAWLLAALWLGCASLTLGATLYISRFQHVAFSQTWHGVVVSPVMPYTWLMRIPGLSAFREADRFALLGLVGAALLAGSAVDWLRRHAWPVIAVVVALGVLEAGWSGSGLRTMPTTLAALDRPIIADHSGSVVLDVPFGLRGGIPEYGLQFPARALLLATEDGHPRSISYTSWVPARTIKGITSHAFYTVLVQAQHAIPIAPDIPCWAGLPDAAGLLGPAHLQARPQPDHPGAAGRGQAGRPEPEHRLGAGVEGEPGGHPLPGRDRFPSRLPGGRRHRVPARHPVGTRLPATGRRGQAPARSRAGALAGAIPGRRDPGLGPRPSGRCGRVAQQALGLQAAHQAPQAADSPARSSADRSARILACRECQAFHTRVATCPPSGVRYSRT